jgi:uncharacterized protein YciI
MFIVYLKFSNNKPKAAELMVGHNEWIKKGFDDGVFLLVGSIEPGQGGMVVAHNTTFADLESRVKLDPFVVEDVVSSEIIQVSAKKADGRLSFLVK